MAKLFIISGPSGTGKTTIKEGILSIRPSLLYSISYTTRLPRGSEKEGKDYFFIERDKFIKMIENQELAEWALVYGNYYGTSRRFLDEALKDSKDVILDLDPKGAVSIKELYGSKAVLIFIIPPSIDILKNRLTTRGDTSFSEMEKRLRSAIKEIKEARTYEYIVVNDNIEQAINEVDAIITAEGTKREERWAIVEKIINSSSYLL